MELKKKFMKLLTFPVDYTFYVTSNAIKLNFDISKANGGNPI